MRRRTETTISTILFAVLSIVMACLGILMGSRQYWFEMGFCFFLVVYSSEVISVVLLNHKIESRFIQLAGLVVSKFESDRLVRKFVPNSVIIVHSIFIVVIYLLLILACECEWGLVLGILLIVFLIGNAVSTAFTVWLKVKVCSKRLEELISSNREGSS